MPVRMLLCAIALGAVAACAKIHGTHSPSAFPSSADVTRGEALFAAQCSACHGARGAGDPAGGAARAEHRATVDGGEAARAKKVGQCARLAMTLWRQLHAR